MAALGPIYNESVEYCALRRGAESYIVIILNINFAFF